MITSAGFRIGPGEIEDCLMRHPAVALAAVVGKPDPIRTEIVKAFIVLKKDHAASDALAAEIQSFVKTRLSGHEYPREVAFIDAMPMTTTGKVIRRLVARESLVRRLAAHDENVEAEPPLGDKIKRNRFANDQRARCRRRRAFDADARNEHDAQHQIDGESAGINRTRIACARPTY